MFTINNNNFDIVDDVNVFAINEYKIRKVSTDPKSFEDLYGELYPKNRYIPEIKEANEYQKMQLEQDNNWKSLCSSSYYAHIRICGRNAQLKSEVTTFSLDDLFRLYRYNAMIGATSMFGQIKIDYNVDANLWVFYVSVRNKVDKDNYIWIQPPKHNGAVQVVCKGLTSNSLILAPYERNRNGIKLINEYKDELETITKTYYKEFSEAFKEAERFFEDGRGRVGDKPINSYAEVPYALLYNRA